jgi:hypothetical protein
LLTVIGDPTDPEDILAARDILEFKSAILASFSTEENYLRPRMEHLVDLGIVGRLSTNKRRATEFTWVVTDTTRRAAREWRALIDDPSGIAEHLDTSFFQTLTQIYDEPRRHSTSSDERLLWFARAYRTIGRDFGFTPGRALALLACLYAWESGVVIEISELFDTVYAAAQSQWAPALHFSGGSRFDREFLIRIDDNLLPQLEGAVLAQRTS